jgi:hypothetical protein
LKNASSGIPSSAANGLGRVALSIASWNDGLSGVVVLKPPSSVQARGAACEEPLVKDALIDLLAKRLDRPFLGMGSRLFDEVGTKPIRDLARAHGAVRRQDRMDVMDDAIPELVGPDGL